MLEPHADPLIELLALTSALRAHAERVKATGGAGLPQALSHPLASDLDSSADVPARRPKSASDAVRGRAPDESSAPAPTARAPSSAVSRVPSANSAGASAPPDDAASQVKRSLELLEQRVRGCTGCGLHRGRNKTVFARGNGQSGVCFVGEGPGADEDAQGFPFVGKAGQLLDRMIVAMGLSRDDVYVCNIVKCRPPDNRKPEPDEMAACTPYLSEQLALVQPQVIVLLGATAVQGLLGITGGITRLRGRWRLYQGRIPVMPTFHPAYLLRNPRAKRDVWEDLQEVMRQLGRPIAPRG